MSPICYNSLTSWQSHDCVSRRKHTKSQASMVTHTFDTLTKTPATDLPVNRVLSVTQHLNCACKRASSHLNSILGRASGWQR